MHRTRQSRGSVPQSSNRAKRVWSRAAGLLRYVRKDPLGVASFLLIAVFILAALLAPLIAPHEPNMQNRQHILEPPSATFIMGTDDLGRDMFSRVLYGAQVSLNVGFFTIAISLVVGTLIGSLSGYFGGAVDMILQRLMDAVLAIPTIILLLFIAALLGASTRNIVISLAIVITPQFNRIARGEVLRIREQGYVEAARATGSNAIRILVKHCLPNMLAPLVTAATLTFAIVIIAEASLSFLGIGTPPPAPAWGRMLSDATRFLQTAPWTVVFPGLALSTAVLAFNLLGDSLRNALDPTRVDRSMTL